MKHYKLEFLTTGIQQCQVDRGVPLATCLMLVRKWLTQQIKQLHLVFPSNNTESDDSKKCMFVTWTDWDLGTCLLNECKRKRINKPTVFNQWANLKALYKVSITINFNNFFFSLFMIISHNNSGSCVLCCAEYNL